MGELYQIVEKKDSKQLAEYLSHNGRNYSPYRLRFGYIIPPQDCEAGAGTFRAHGCLE